MNTKKNVTITMMLMFSVSFMVFSLTGCTKETTTVATADDLLTKEALLNYTIADTSQSGTFYCADSLPLEPLTEAETAALLMMREEEYLAHDVYITLSLLYTKPIFRNIARSEQRHTDAVKALITKYGLIDPAANHVTGVFSSEEIQTLYNSLVSLGSTSLINALVVGATIEDLDIKDLQNQLLVVDNQDITCVFNNLMRGSRNHLRSFYANVKFTGGTYTPQYLTQAEFDAIVNSKHEIGSGHCN